MAIWDYWFKEKPKKTEKMTLQEAIKIMSVQGAFFQSFGPDITKSVVTRSCIKPIAEASSKLNVQVYRRQNGNIIRDALNDRLERMLAQRPNPLMNGKDFLYKLRFLLERDNTAFIYIERDGYGGINAFWPVPQTTVEIKTDGDDVFFLFNLTGGRIVAELKDVAILRNDYGADLMAGDAPSNALIPALELINTTNQGMANTIKTSANLKGLLKTQKAMLSDADRKKISDTFVSDYLNLENVSGIATLDASMEYVPLNTGEIMVNAAHMRELRENVMRYFGVNDSIMLSNFTEEQWEAFYENKIEPFALALGLELTNKCFTEHERAFGNQIVFAGNRLMYASTATKLSFQQLVDRGTISPNEHRAMFGLEPRPGGDEFVIRKEYGSAEEAEPGGAADDESGVEETAETADKNGGNKE